MLAVLAVMAAQQCAEAEREAAEPPENMLSYGLTHLWTSPILRYQLMKPGHASLRLLEAAVLARYEAFRDNCTHSRLRPVETANDAWFAEQRAAFERGDDSWLEEPGSGAAVEAAMKQLRGAWLSNAREYVGSAVGDDAADDFFVDPTALRLFVWAAAHDGCSLHTPHVHQVRPTLCLLALALAPSPVLVPSPGPRPGIEFLALALTLAPSPDPGPGTRPGSAGAPTFDLRHTDRHRQRNARPTPRDDHLTRRAPSPGSST